MKVKINCGVRRKRGVSRIFSAVYQTQHAIRGGLAYAAGPVLTCVKADAAK